MKRIVLFSLICIVVLWVLPACANVAPDDLPVSVPLAKMGNSMKFSLAPILIRIAIIIAGIYLCYSRSMGALIAFVAIAVGGTIALKSDEMMTYWTWSGMIF